MKLTSGDWSGLIGLLIALLFLIVLFLQSCNPTVRNVDNKIIPIAKGKTGYELESFDKEIHQYRDDVTTLDLPIDNSKLTQYCMIHYEWENIIVFTTTYGTKYRVRKDK